MHQLSTAVLAIVGTIFLVVIFGLLLAWPMSWLFNGCLVPAAPFLKPVGILQMWGINILFGLWFKSSSK